MVMVMLYQTALSFESQTTAADFNKSSSKINPDIFIRRSDLNEENLLAYAKSQSPAATRALERRELSIGNAIDLTVWLISTAVNPKADEELGLTAVEIVNLVFTNWNLDSDRGYGYKTWQHGEWEGDTFKGGVPDPREPSGVVTDERWDE